MKIKTVIIALQLLVVNATAPAIGQSADEPSKKISHKELTRRLKDVNPAVYYGGVMIATADTVQGPIVVIDGVLDIQDGGVLDGDAWIVGGRLIMTGDAKVNGQIYLVQSEAFRSRLAEISGGITKFACECRFDAVAFEESGDVFFVKHEDPMAIKTRLAVKPGLPTRVQYTVLRLGLERKNPRRRDPYVSGYALVDIPIWSSTHGHFGFNAEATVPLWGHRIGLVLGGFKTIITNDSWQVSRVENAGTLVLTGYEFADYYERHGISAGLLFGFTEHLNLLTDASYGRDYSLQTGKAPSLFNSNQRLPVNPPIDDGVRVMASASLVYDSRREPARPRSAWYVELWGEKGFDSGPGEFNYEAFSIDLRKYMRLPHRLQLDLRGKLFSTIGEAPRQVYQSLGGYGGVRGLSDHPFEVRRGNRMTVYTVELRRQLPDVRFVSALFTSWDLLLFSDVGLLVEAKDQNDAFEFLETPFDDWGKSIGVGISGESVLPYVGVYVARGVEGGQETWRAILRIERSF
jgi:hypothetical protein